MSTFRSCGWDTQVLAGREQTRVLRLLRVASRHPSRIWHPLPPLRVLGPNGWRTLRRLEELGFIHVYATRGRNGRTRFMWVTHKWRTRALPDRRGVWTRIIAAARAMADAVAEEVARVFHVKHSDPGPLAQAGPSPFEQAMARYGRPRFTT